jgi:2-dehydro-3-deoxyglucarate aldolase/4-hydroxy-2-oxoheptanedioate aldolase
MLTNRVKRALREGQAVTGPMVNEARSVSTVKMLALAGHDFFIVDMEHAMFDWETAHNLVQMALVCGICPIVRVTDLAYHLVARALDTGARGVMIPRVEHREQVEQAISYAKYPPLGRRGAGGEARLGYERRDPKTAIAEANAETMVVVQVETVAGLERIEEITAVRELDVLCVGPHDLSISLGIPGGYDEPAFLDAIGRIVAAGTANGVAVGMVEKDAALLERWYGMGCRFLVCNSDGNMIAQGAQRDVATLRGFIGTA